MNTNYSLRRATTAFTTNFVVPIPHRSLPPLRGGADEDFVSICYSHVITGDWPRLASILPSAVTPLRTAHLLLRLRRNPTLSLSLYNFLLVQSPSSLSLLPKSILIHILASSNLLVSIHNIIMEILDSNTDAYQLFDEMLFSYRVSETSSTAAFDCLFSILARRKKFRDATEIFRRMRDHGVFPTLRSCNAYLSALLALSRADIALSFYSEMQRSRISPNVYTINMVMRAMLNAPGKMDKTMSLFDNMESMGINPTVATFNTLIDGYCKNGLMGPAVKLKNMMASKGLEPDVVTYNTIIHGFCKEGKLYEANKVFKEMKSREVIPNAVTYNTMIFGYGRTNNSEMGMRLYEEMKKNGVGVDIVTYNALISGFCNEGKTKKAAGLVKELDAENLVPNAATYVALISGQCKRQNSERAFQVYKAMKRSGCRMNCRVFKLLISTFCKNKDFDGAIEVVRDMLDGWITPHDDVLAELTDALHNAGKSDVAAKLMMEIYKCKQNSEVFLDVDFSGNEPGDEGYLLRRKTVENFDVGDIALSGRHSPYIAR